ncbi:ABC transporter permease subunit [Kaistia dalseonensis]|uniref:NitT/TauT family transport system permease protein n=1 Tax=Kaistia dalseonensis TaxID=410840 RepID=A0ABU0H7X0_9HYPH|nr:ABC transporter permease subunit [Kaistia dalseonensis]MCX5495525.1 ABC transporter permease subunit [Kaistia dalseonensis]MDQ0438117.1 NitT/TauT family transport system permease protein [Kaistia dalseonensis]
MTKMLKTFVSRYWGVAGVLLFWQAWVTITGVNSIVVPHPIDVARDIVTEPGVYLSNGSQTLFLAALGLVLGMALGTLVAVLAWSSDILSGILTPLGLVFSSVPVVALIPIIARLFGYDVKTVLAIVVIISFFPAFVFTSAGLKTLPAGSDDLFRVFGASRWTRFVRLVLPSAVPNWMIAFRLAAPPAVLSAMVAEFLMGTSGLGYLFRSAASNFQTDRAFGTSVVATIISVICFGLALSAERAVLKRWT